MPDREMTEAELRALLKPRRSPPREVRKSRQWVMSRRDIAAFMTLLRQAFPSIVFLMRREVDGQGRWALQPDSPDSADYIYATLAPDGWDAQAFCARPGDLPGPCFRFCGSGRPYVLTDESGRVVEGLDLGFLQAQHMRSDREMARLVGRVWRLSGKIATNQIKTVDMDTGGTTWPSSKDGQWYGLDALAWCQQRLNRTLAGNVRPTDDWRMPDLPIYPRRRRFVKHDYAAYWAGIEKLRDRIPLFSWPIGYRRSDGAMVTANDIGFDVDQLIPIEELDRARLAAVVRKRWEAGEWDPYNARVTLEQAIARLDTEDPHYIGSDFHLGLIKLEWAIKRLRIVPEFRQFLKTGG